MTDIRVVRYTTTAASTDENRRLVSDVYDQLHAQAPAGFRYGTFLLPEEHSFVHVALLEGDDAPLPGLPAFRAFQSGLADRTVGSVANRRAELVGNYRLL